MLIRLISWSPEAAGRARLIEAAGFTVDASEHRPGRTIGHVRDLAPAAVLIDLDRMPSHGRAVAMVLRSSRSTCHFPIVFAGGQPEKIDRVRKDLPDAVFATWNRAASELKKTIRRAPAAVPLPRPYMAPWIGSKLVKKLDFKPGLKVAMLGSPEGFEETLGELPDAVELGSAVRRDTGLALWFVRSRRELEEEIGFVTARLPARISLWIAFPKQSGGLHADFNQTDVRAAALVHGLVDYKICAIDADWSGLKFARKKR